MKHKDTLLAEDEITKDQNFESGLTNQSPESSVDAQPDPSTAKIEKQSLKELKRNKRKKSKSDFDKVVSQKKQDAEPVRKIKRIKTEPDVGLTVEQVIERINKGYTNKTLNTNVKTYSSIFINNIFTFFNILCFAVAISLIIARSFKDLLFMVVVLCNIAIGIIQEIRAKRTIEKLSLLTAPTAKVIRGGTEYEVTTEEVVIDDIMCLSNGK